MIFDGNVHIADDGDSAGYATSHLTGEGLLELLDGPYMVAGQERIIEKALVQPRGYPVREGDPHEHHRYVAAQVDAHPNRFVGCLMANPLLDLDATVSVIRELARVGSFRAIKLHPTAHGYMPFKVRKRLDPIMQAALEFDLAVLIHQGDAPFSHPSQVASLIEDFPRVPFILAHFGTQRIVMADEAIYVARKNPNVYLETDWGSLPRIKEGIAALGPGRLMFASDCPVQEMGSQLRVLEVLGWKPPIGIGLPEDQLEKILGGNLARLLGEV